MTHRFIWLGSLTLFAGAALCGAAETSSTAPAKAAEGGKLKVTVEFRTRYESKEGVTFGKDPDLATALVRTRVGLSYKPVSWIKFSGMMQDTRAPFYGKNAPNTVRDSADLQEGYMELFPDRKLGFGMQAGRAMLNYGEGRMIGTPQWGNNSRTYDAARAYYRWTGAQLEFLAVSPVKIDLNGFNRPVLGDHIWGTYNVFPNLFRKTTVEAYLLRREQNRPGGFTGGSKALGTDKQSVEAYGFRIIGPLAKGVKFMAEGVTQTGKIGAAGHRGAAWVSNVSRRWKVKGKPVDLLAEYKYASGNPNPQDTTRSRTFDQLYASNHDRFGHQDLFGWRNIHNVKVLATGGLTKRFSLNLMYGSFWLASARDYLYNGSGKSIVRSANGTGGRHVGQEWDAFGTYKFKHVVFGAGYGYLIKGEFIRRTTPGVNPSYVYCFQTFTM